MLIECNYCGAPLDVKPNQRLSKCKYCGTTSKVSSNRTVAFETPQNWQPPQRWQPPPHVPADSSKTLVYHAASAVRRIVSAVVTLAFLGALVPVAILFFQQQKEALPEVAGALEAARTALDQARAQANTARQFAGGATENLYEGTAALDLSKKFSERLGGKPVQAMRFVVYPAYAILDAQDPERPRHVDRYVYRGGAIGEGEPVNVQHVRGKLEDHLFSLDDVVLDKLPDLVLGTLAELNYEEGKASHVIIQRNVPFSKNVVIRVYVSGPRESGRIDYTGDGKVQRVYK